MSARSRSPSRGTPANIRIYLIFLETTIIGLHFAADNIGLSSLNFFWWAQILFISARVTDVSAVQGHPVIDVGTNRKRVCDFLLAVIATLVISCTVSEILHVSLCSYAHPYSTLILGCSSCTRLPRCTDKRPPDIRPPDKRPLKMPTPDKRPHGQKTTRTKATIVEIL